MFKLIKRLGKFIVRAYIAEGRRLEAQAKAEAKVARELAEKVAKLHDASLVHIDEAAKVAAQAQQLSVFFD